jgi:hypothetical protein
MTYPHDPVDFPTDPHPVRPGTSEALTARTIDATVHSPLVRVCELSAISGDARRHSHIDVAGGANEIAAGSPFVGGGDADHADIIPDNPEFSATANRRQRDR